MRKFTKVYLPTLELPATHAAKTTMPYSRLRNSFRMLFLAGIMGLSALLSANKASATAHSAVLAAGTFPTGTTICKSAALQVIYSFKLTQTGTNTLTSFVFTTSGTYAAADITSFQLYYAVTTNAVTSATLFGTVTTGLGAGSHTIGGSQSLTAAAHYFFIVANVAAGATSGDNITVATITNTTATTNFTFSTTGETYTGTAAAAITQTIEASPTITSSPSAICPGATTTLSATPTGGTWASATTANATVNSTSGVVTGVIATGGTDVITYTQGGCPATITETVNAGPTPIVLTPAASYSICPGGSATVTASSAAPVPTVVLSNNFNATPNGLVGQVGGTWTVNNTGTSSTFIADESEEDAFTWGIYSSGSTVEFGDESVPGDGTPWAGSSPTGDYYTMISQLITPSFSTAGYTSANLTFNQYGLMYYGYDQNYEIDYSINGGATWAILHNYYISGDEITTGLPTWSAATPTSTIALPAGALGQPNVMLRWYLNTTGFTWWVIDNVVVSASPSTLPASVFTWAGPSGLSCTGDCYTSTLSPTAGGLNVYTVSATYLTCTATAPVTVNVEVPPNITGDAPVCIGSTVNLFNTMGGGTWSSNNAALATVNSTSGLVTGIASGNPIITYTIPLGCTTTVQASVNPLPNVSTFSTSAAAACPGASSAVTVNSSTLGTASYTVNYTLSGTNTATATTTLNMVSGTGTFNTVAMTNPGSTTVTINSITNITNCSTSPSSGNTATFTVNPTPSAIGGTRIVCAGAVTSLSDAGGGAWSSGNTAIATVDAFGNVNGVSGGTVSITYTLPTGCNTASNVTVNSVPAISGLSAVCFGQTTTLSDAATGGAWSSTNTAIASIGSGSGFVTGGTSVGTTTISYTLAVNSCAATLAFGVTNTPGVFTVTGGGAYCVGGTGMHIGLTGSNPDVSYQLYVSGTTPVGSAVLGTGGTVDFGPQTITGTYTVVANPGTACSTTMAGSATISTNALPNGSYTVGGGGSFCSGGIGEHITLSNSDFGVNYQLFDGSLPVGGTLAGVAGLLTFPLQTASGVYTVVAINSAGCTQTMTGSATITNNPLPGTYIVTGGGPFCASPGSTGVPIGLSNSDAGTTYKIYNSGTFVTSVTGTGSILSLGLETISGTYTVTATSAFGCFNNMTGSAVVTANPIPTAANVINGGAYCAGGAGVHVGLSSSQVGVSYQLQNASIATGSPVAGTSFALDFGLQTVTGAYTVLATNATTGCSNMMTGSVTVTTNPLPVSTYSVTGGGSYCTGAAGVAVGLSGSTSGVSYQLYNGSTPTGIIVTGTGSAIPFGTITASGTYYVIATNTATGCTATMTGNALVIINIPPPVYSALGGGNYCIGGTGVPVVLNGSTVGITYQLYKGATLLIGDTLDGTGYALNFGLQTVAGSYNIVATNEATGCTSNMFGSAIIAINPLPVRYEVTGGGGYCPGGTGVHVGLSGSDMGVNYTLIIGSTPSAILPGTGGALDFGLEASLTNYTITAANATTGCSDTMSGFASISINPVPTVYPVISSAGSYCAGGTGVAIGIGNSSTLATYQLYLNGSPVGLPMSGSGSGFNFPNQTAAGLYTVTATNLVFYCVSNMSGSATVSVNPLPVAFTVTGGGGYCAGAAGVPVGLSGSASGVGYQLMNGGGAAIGSSVAGTGSAITFGIDTAGTYTVLATNATTTCSVNMFSSATVVKNTPPTAYSLSGGGGYCAGGTGRLVGMSSSNTGVNYQLYDNGVSVGAPAPGTGGAFNFGLETAPGAYTVVATNLSTTCVNNMSDTETITINPLPTADTVTGGGNYCSGDTGLDVGLSSSSIGIGYQLLNGSTLVGGTTSGSGAAINFGPQLAAGTYTVVASNSVTTCTNNMYGSVTIAINPLPTVYYITGGGAHCPGSAGNHILLNGSDAGISYQLQIGGVSTGSPMAGAGIFLDFGTQSTAGVYTILATNTVTGCTRTMSGSTTVSVSPLPTVDTVTGGGNYCPGGTGVAVTLNNSSTGVNYQLMQGSFTSGSAVAGTGSMLTLGTETALGTYTVIATDTTTGCSANMYGSATVGYFPLPASFVVSGGGNYCPGGTGVPVIMGGSQAGTSYQLFDGGIMEGGPVGGTGTGINFGLQTATGTYTVVATNTSTTCSSNMSGSATIATYPLPAAYNVTGGGNYCTGGSGVVVSLAGSNSGINYQLFNNGSAVVSGAMSGTGAGLNFGLQTAPGNYTVIATNATTGCMNNMADTAIVGIRPLPAIYTVSSSSSGYCAGGDGVDIYISNSDLGVNYQLYRGGTMVGVPVLGSGSALDFGAQTTAGIYTVVAIDASAGCMSNMSGSASVSIKPLPAAFNVIGGGGYCAGGAGQHIGLNNSVAGISYQLWLGGVATGAVIPGTGAAIDFGAQTTAGSYTATATDTVSGCTSNMSGAATIIINPLPGIFSVIGGGGYCEGGTGVAIGLGGSAASGITYQLSRSGASVGVPLAATGAALSFGLQTAAGTYIVTATNTATSCSAVMASGATITINTPPTVYTMTGGGSYCNGGTGVPVGLGGSTSGVQYQLYRAGIMTGASVAGTGDPLTFGIETTAGAYTVVATNDATSCTGDMAGAATITINPLPTVYNVIGGGNYCPGAGGVHVGLNGSAIGLLYTLSLSSVPVTGGTVTGTGSPVDFGLQTGVGSYTVSATNPGTGCTNNMAGSAIIGVSAPVTPAVSIATGSGDTVCSGNSTTFSATVTNGGSTPSYQWSVNGVLASYSSAYTYIPMNGDNVSLALTSSAACATPATVNSSLTISVLDNELPAVSVAVSPGTEVCQGVIVNFTASPSYGGTTPSYQWVVNTATVPAASGPAYSYAPAQGDIIYAQMASNYPCRLANVATSGNIIMTVDSPIIPVVTINAYPGAHVGQGQPVTLTATVDHGGPDPTFQWFINGTAVVGAVSSTFTTANYSNLDSVSLQVTSSGPCSGLVGFNSLLIYTNEGVAQVNNNGGDIVLIPNPNKGAFTVKGSIGTLTDEEVSLEVYDMLGQVIYKSNVMAHGGNINEQIQLSGNLANGMYILNLRSASQNSVFHFVVEQ